MLPVLDIWEVSFSIRASIYEKLFFKEFIIKSKLFVVLVIFLNLFCIPELCHILGAVSKPARCLWRREIWAILNPAV